MLGANLVFFAVIFTGCSGTASSTGSSSCAAPASPVSGAAAEAVVVVRPPEEHDEGPTCFTQAGPSSFRVSDGTRTRDILDHNQVLYQLSYTHHDRRFIRRVSPTGREKVYRV